jgi:hypothetical protein
MTPITIRGRESTVIPEGIHPAKITAVKVEKRGKECFSGDSVWNVFQMITLD